MQVALDYSFSEGRGFVAATNIRKGERLLNIPEDLVVTPDAALQCSAVGGLLERTGQPAWSVLAVLLAETRCQGPAAHNKWGPYTAALPPHSGSVLEWSKAEVGDHAFSGVSSALRWYCCGQGGSAARVVVQLGMLRGSPSHKDAKRILQSYEASVAGLEEVLQAGSQLGLLRAPLGQGALRWAFSMLLSRAIRWRCTLCHGAL